MEKCKVLVPVGCRSDAGLTEPIVRRLREQDWCELELLQLEAGKFVTSLNIVDLHLYQHEYDLMVCMADRIEMAAAACAAFHNNVKIAHVYAGITNIPLSTLDDINRHAITLWADLAFCESIKACEVVDFLWKTIYKPVHDNIYNVGITHMDDVEVDESLVPDEDYDLILLNPTTIKTPFKMSNCEISVKGLFSIKTIIIGSNPDPDINFLIKGIKADYANLPRPQFLGLLKNCKRYITNSSSAYYEAPQWLTEDQIILIGERNKNRSTPKKLETGASDRIVETLGKWWVDKSE